jgi:hypothetical protein
MRLMMRNLNPHRGHNQAKARQKGYKDPKPRHIFCLHLRLSTKSRKYSNRDLVAVHHDTKPLRGFESLKDIVNVSDHRPSDMVHGMRLVMGRSDIYD